jgi:hypothetical protein
MPISRNPLEYYHYYCASQRRVEKWLQDTGPGSPPQSETSTMQWLGFLEDPGLATPISRPLPLDKPKCESHLAGIPEHNSQDHPSPETELMRTHDGGPLAAGECRPSLTATSKECHGDSALSQRSRAGSQQLPRSDEKPAADHVPAVPTSSNDSKRTSKSKNSNSSSSRRRQSRKEVDIRPSIFAYIPYGIIPLLFAITTGSSAVSLAAASIMLAGYFCLDYTSTVSLSSIFIFAHSSELHRQAEKRHSQK